MGKINIVVHKIYALVARSVKVITFVVNDQIGSQICKKKIINLLDRQPKKKDYYKTATAKTASTLDFDAG